MIIRFLMKHVVFWSCRLDAKHRTIMSYRASMQNIERPRKHGRLTMWSIRYMIDQLCGWSVSYWINIRTFLKIRKKIPNDCNRKSINGPPNWHEKQTKKTMQMNIVGTSQIDLTWDHFWSPNLKHNWPYMTPEILSSSLIYRWNCVITQRFTRKRMSRRKNKIKFWNNICDAM